MQKPTKSLQLPRASARVWQLTAFVLALSPLPLAAQAQPVGPPPQVKASPPATQSPAAKTLATQVPLTGDLVQSFIKSFPDVRKTTDGMAAKYKVGTQPAIAAAGAFGAWMTIAAAQGELNAMVGKYGFKDFTQWVGVMISVEAAFALGGTDSPDAAIAQAIAKVQSDPKMSDAQKQQLIAAMQKGSAVAVANRPSQQNIDAVKPFTADLKALLK